jgi:hypothetical protein
MCYARYLDDNHIIYGMDDPQKTYLGLMRFYRWFVSGYRGRRTPDKLRALIKNGIERNRRGKDFAPQVSNYVLDFDADDVAWGDNSGLRIERTPRRETNASRVRRETARRAFTERFKDSHFALANTDYERRLAGAQKNRPYIEDLDQRGYSDARFATDMKSFAVRRACKFLIYDSIAEGKTVVYSLDDLNLKAIADALWINIPETGKPSFGTREEINEMDGFKKVPICTSEVRELFRCWDYFKEPLKSGLPKVEFMRGFEKCPPPWETSDLESWARYAKEQAEKWFPELPAPVQTSKQGLYDAIAPALDGRDYAKAIRSYHGLGVGAYKSGARSLPVEA